ncbi:MULTISPECIES: hypothetical protein [unclassified Xanthobacter]|uniref:hypothetical protein n=1 Tax=unclassified Xanthobacter TaxID=2623496 RepID=UPI001F4350E6|nr:MULTISPECIES: hypothetical protein [unclassified Xanthobacter]
MADFSTSRLRIGGAMSPRTMEEFRAVLEGGCEDVGAALDEAVTAGGDLTVTPAGGAERIVEFCRRHALAYKLSGADSCLESWRPGMMGPDVFAAASGVATALAADLDEAARHGSDGVQHLLMRLQRANEPLPALSIFDPEAELITIRQAVVDFQSRLGRGRPSPADIRRLLAVIGVPGAAGNFSDAGLVPESEVPASGDLSTDAFIAAARTQGRALEALLELLVRIVTAIRDELARDPAPPAPEGVRASAHPGAGPVCAEECSELPEMDLASQVREPQQGGVAAGGGDAEEIREEYDGGIAVDNADSRWTSDRPDNGEELWAEAPVLAALDVEVPASSADRVESRPSAGTAAETVARLAGWTPATVDGVRVWWNRKISASPESAVRSEEVHRSPEEVCAGEGLDLHLAPLARNSEDCVFITTCHGDALTAAGPLPADVYRLVEAFAGDSCFVATREDTTGLLVEEGFVAQDLPGDLAAAVREIAARYPEADVWLTAGSHVEHESRTALRAFIPAGEVQKERVERLVDEVQDITGTVPVPVPSAVALAL